MKMLNQWLVDPSKLLSAVAVLGVVVLVLILGLGITSEDGKDGANGGSLDESTLQYAAVISGGTQVPPNRSTGVGGAHFSFDEDMRHVAYWVSFYRLVGGMTTGLHIHKAPPGLVGPIEYDLGGNAGVSPTGFGSPLKGEMPFKPSDISALEAKKLYVNLHTADFLGGELRAHLMPLETTVVMNGENVVRSNDSEGWGRFYFSLGETTNTLFYSLRFDKLSGATTTGFHIHRAEAGADGPIIHDLGANSGVPFSGFDSPVVGMIKLSAVDVEDLKAGRLFANLQTDAFPDGEIRGQMMVGTLSMDGG